MEQATVTVRDVDYYNFFHVPGSIDSLESYLEDGWVVKFIKDNGNMATILFERGQDMKLEEIEKLCEEATPGPWEWTGYIVENEEKRIVTTDGSYNEDRTHNQKADGEFIASSRVLLPKLLSVAKAAKDVAQGEGYYRHEEWEKLNKALEELED